jgi:multiple antibiotic resistance protein
MVDIDANFYLQATVAMIMITWVPDPVKVLVFNSVIDSSGTKRVAGAIRVATTVAIILAISVVLGKQLLGAMGINLNAFGIVGGIVVAGMGFEMLYKGGPSKAQGADEEDEGPTEDSGLLMPLSIPLIAGPGAITTAITISSTNDGSTDALVAGLIACGVVVLLSFVVFAWGSALLAKMSDSAAAISARLGGMLLATIGLQFALTGLRNFYEF